VEILLPVDARLCLGRAAKLRGGALTSSSAASEKPWPAARRSGHQGLLDK
jgi:hypothetical protein